MNAEPSLAEPAADAFIAAMDATGYIVPVLGVIEVASGTRGEAGRHVTKGVESMVLTRVVIEPKEGLSDQFEVALRSILAETRALTGCGRSEWYRDPEVPGRYVTFSAFDSLDHFREYRRSPVVARIGRELLPLLNAPPAFEHYDGRVFEQSP